MDPTTLKLVQYAGYGALAGLIGACAKSRTLALPRVIRQGVNEGERVALLDLGFLAAPLLGGVIAAIVDGRPEHALAYGVAAGFVGPAVINTILDPALVRLGLAPAPPPREETAHGVSEDRPELRAPGGDGRHRGRDRKHHG